MYHTIGERFTNIDGVRQKLRLIGSRWNTKISPAIVEYSTEIGNAPPESDDLNGKVYNA